MQLDHSSRIPVGRQPYIDPVARHDLGRMEHACPKCGALHWLDERVQKTGSTSFHPLFGMCCGDGTIELPAPAPAPEPLQQFFSATTPEAQNFHENIHQYNSALSFTSLEARVDDSVNRGGGGPPVFKIHGELHHQIGSLLPPHGQLPVYAQLYILDPREALKHRMERNSGLDPDVMYRLGGLDPDMMYCLGGLISESHRWATIFKQAHEVFETSDVNQVSLRLTVNHNQDHWQYNLPTSDEVAAIVPGDETRVVGHRDIVLWQRD